MNGVSYMLHNVLVTLRSSLELLETIIEQGEDNHWKACQEYETIIRDLGVDLGKQKDENLVLTSKVETLKKELEYKHQYLSFDDDYFDRIIKAFAVAHPNRKIDAIKLVRTLTNASLKESKDFVEALPQYPPINYYK